MKWLRSHLRGSATPELVITLAMVLLLVVVSILVGGRPAQSELPLDPQSTGPRGLAVLRMWLDEMGYQVETLHTGRFQIPENTDMILVFNNKRPYTVVEADHLAEWVTAGGTLILASIPPDETALANAFGVRTRRQYDEPRPLSQSQPLWPEGAATIDQTARGRTLDINKARESVKALRRESAMDLPLRAAAAIQPFGEGLVWHFSEQVRIDNTTLHNEEVASLVPALLRTVPEGGKIMFDTYHLYAIPDSSGQVNSLRDWAILTAWGRALSFSLIVLAAYFVLQGIRLGPPLPSEHLVPPREAAEYVVAIGRLHQRARHNQYVISHHTRRLKMAVGRPYQVSADLPDTAFLYELQQRHTHLTEDQFTRLQTLLSQLSAIKGDVHLVELVAEVDKLLAKNS